MEDVLDVRTVIFDEVDLLDRPLAYISDEGDVSAWTGFDFYRNRNLHSNGEKQAGNNLYAIER